MVRNWYTARATWSLGLLNKHKLYSGLRESCSMKICNVTYITACCVTLESGCYILPEAVDLEVVSFSLVSKTRLVARWLVSVLWLVIFVAIALSIVLLKNVKELPYWTVISLQQFAICWMGMIYHACHKKLFFAVFTRLNEIRRSLLPAICFLTKSYSWFRKKEKKVLKL